MGKIRQATSLEPERIMAPTANGKTTDSLSMVIAGRDICRPDIEIPVDDWPLDVPLLQTNRKARRARKSIARRYS